MRSVGQTVRPETVVEKSFMESVSGLINEVAPSSYYQSHACHHSGDHTEPVQWARFEQCDAADYWPTGGTGAAAGTGDSLSTVSRPLLLVLGYSSGVQVWSVGGGGLAQEVLSWRQGVARDARLLPAPTGGAAAGDIYGARRPLLALCVAAGTETLFSSVSVVSLRTGEQVKSIKFQSSISGLVVSKRALVVTFVGKLAVFDARTFEDRFTVTTCYPSPGLEDNPIALGDRWLAYGERCHDLYLESRGGLCTDYSASYTASVFHAAKSITKGLRDLSEGLACKFSGGGGGGSGGGAGGAHPAPAGSAVHSVGGVSGGGQLAGPGANYQGGLVTVLDVVTAGAPPTTSQESADDSEGVREGSRGVLAHFQAHTLPLVQLCFDRSGSLLLTADKSGHSFHVFRVEPHPVRPALAQVTQLYALYRGDTSAKVVDMTFSGDSRWVSVATHRGTTHLFPVSPYGGPITARTHCGVRVVNKLSRFHKSAGFEDVSHCSGRVSPVLRQRHLSGVTPSVVVPPLAQLRQPILSQFTVSGSQSGGRVSGASSAGAAGGASSGDDGSHVRVVSTFAASRGWSPPCHAAAPPPPPTSLAARDAASVDALYVFNCNSATLIEYQVQPRATALVAKDKVPQDSPIEVQVHAQARWLLARQTVWPELRPPLLPLNPLLAVCCAGGGGDALETGATSSADTSSECAIEHWVSQVEILTHAGPHRRLWMGPQFSFRPYSSGTPDDSSETRDLLATVQSSPLNLPAQLVSLSIECGSASSVSEVCPRLVDACDVVAPSVLTDCLAAHSPGGATGGSSSSSALQQQLADAMADTVAAASCDDNQQQLLDSCFAAASVTGDGSMCETMTSLLSSPPTRVRRDESPHSSTSSSSVDIRSSPDPRAPSPLDFSIYTDPPPAPDSPRHQQQQQSEHMSAVRCSERAEGPEQEEQEEDEEQLAEQGWGEDIILAADPWDSASVWPSAQPCSAQAVSAPVDHPLPVSDDDQKPTPSTKRRGKKKRK